MQFNTRIIHGMVVRILAVESVGLILLEWIMELQEKPKALDWSQGFTSIMVLFIEWSFQSLLWNLLRCFCMSDKVLQI